MRKFIKDYLAKEYDNYVKDLEALTNIDSEGFGIADQYRQRQRRFGGHGSRQ